MRDTHRGESPVFESFFHSYTYPSLRTLKHSLILIGQAVRRNGKYFT